MWLICTTFMSRYKLNPVLVDGKIPPKVKRDAHDIILDFIRSRPPLRPVSRFSGCCVAYSRAEENQNQLNNNQL